MTDGIRVSAIINQAVGGQTSADQLAILQAQGVQGAQFVFIFVGTNDIQGGVASSVTVGNVSAMIDFVRPGAVPIICIPPLWYPNTFTAGTGQNTSGYQAGGATRALLLRLAGTKNVKCVDMTQVMGVTVATDRAANPLAGFPAPLRDNLHPNAYGYRMVGWANARALLGAYGGAVSREMTPSFLPSSILRNGWTMSFEPPTFSFDLSGRCKLTGVLEPGTMTVNTVICNLPEPARVLRPGHAVTATSNGICTLGLNPNGDVYLATAPPAGALWVSLDIPAYNTSQ